MTLTRNLAISFLLLGTVLYFLLLLSAIAEADFCVNLSILKRISEKTDFKKCKDFHLFRQIFIFLIKIPALRENFLIFVRVNALYVIFTPIMGLIACSFKIFLQQICEAVFFISYVAILNRAGVVFSLETYYWDLSLLGDQILRTGYNHYINELTALLCVLFVVRLFVLMTFIPCHKTETDDSRIPRERGFVVWFVGFLYNIFWRFFLQFGSAFLVV